ncbi:MAG: polyprenyl diphosphate synthase, partial [Xanthomonadales bacterium]|nr:polyprenyl diphosphate synthase [Xanthomonadales bacterium]
MKSEGDIPAHVAIVMDGNGRWAVQRKRPRTFGHQAGLKALRRIVEHCGRLGVRQLTVFIGDLSAFSPELQEKVRQAETQTRDNERMTLNVAANYGGRWDIVNAARLLAAEVASGRMQVEQIDEFAFGARLALAGGGDPDLFIRTGGEMRISNFLLWQSAYTELY